MVSDLLYLPFFTNQFLLLSYMLAAWFTEASLLEASLSFLHLFSEPCTLAPSILTTSGADSRPTKRPCIQELCIQELWLERLLTSSLLQEQDEAVYPGAVYPGAVCPGAVYPGAVYPGAVAGETPDIFTASGAGWGRVSRSCVSRRPCIQELWQEMLLTYSLLQEQDEAD